MRISGLEFRRVLFRSQQGTTSAGVFSVCPDRRFALSEGMDMDLVKKRKEELGLTNKDIAAALKIDVSAVSKLLSGKRQLKANEAQILADLLKIDAIGSPIIRQIPMIGKASAGAWKEAIHDPMGRSEEHTSELQSLMRISSAVFCLKKTK